MLLAVGGRAVARHRQILDLRRQVQGIVHPLGHHQVDEVPHDRVQEFRVLVQVPRKKVRVAAGDPRARETAANAHPAVDLVVDHQVVGAAPLPVQVLPEALDLGLHIGALVGALE